MSQLLKAFKNPRQPPPAFHYRTVNEQQEVGGDTRGLNVPQPLTRWAPTPRWSTIPCQRTSFI